MLHMARMRREINRAFSGTGRTDAAGWLFAHWRELSGTTAPYTSTTRSRVFRAFLHFPQLATEKVRLFNEIEDGDCIADIPGDSELPAVDSLTFTFQYPVRLAATGATTASGMPKVDGVTCAAGDRVLLPSQSEAAASGVYVAGASAWGLDANTLNARLGFPLLVREGTTLAGTAYRRGPGGSWHWLHDQAPDPRVWKLQKTGDLLSAAWDVEAGGQRFVRTLLLRRAP